MNFLGMGPGELMLIALLGLIIFGPGKLPEIAGQLGRTVRDFRRSTAEIQSEFQRTFSLEEPDEAPAPVGAAEVFASNGATAVDQPTETAPVAAGPEPALATSSEWHWEAGPEQDGTANGTARVDTLADTFWDWSPPEPVATP